MVVGGDAPPAAPAVLGPQGLFDVADGAVAELDMDPTGGLRAEIIVLRGVVQSVLGVVPDSAQLFLPPLLRVDHGDYLQVLIIVLLVGK